MVGTFLFNFPSVDVREISRDQPNACARTRVQRHPCFFFLRYNAVMAYCTSVRQELSEINYDAGQQLSAEMIMYKPAHCMV